MHICPVRHRLSGRFFYHYKMRHYNYHSLPYSRHSQKPAVTQDFAYYPTLELYLRRILDECADLDNFLTFSHLDPLAK